MERVAESLKSKVMSAQQAAQFVKSGMVLGISGFTSVGSPKAVPLALVESGHAKDLTISVGAAVSDEVDVWFPAVLVISPTATCARPSTAALWNSAIFTSLTCP